MYNHIYGLNTKCVFPMKRYLVSIIILCRKTEKLKIDHMKFDKDKRLSLGAGVLIQKNARFF